MDAAYTVWPALPCSATAEDMFTIRPNLARSMPRSAACVHRNEPRTFVAITRSYVSMEYFTRRPSWEKPALFTSPVTAPASSLTRRNASCTLDSSVMSRYTARPGFPAASSAATVSFASVSFER